jgi:hypothetical protein
MAVTILFPQPSVSKNRISDTMTSIFNKLNAKRKTVMLTSLAALLLLACNKQPIGPTEPDPTAPGTYMGIAQFRTLYTGSGDVYVPAGTKKIMGVVISNSANEAAGNFRVQDTSGGGIYLYTVAGSPVYPQGSLLEIDAAGVGVFTLFNGDLELKSVPKERIKVMPGTLNVAPRVATVAQVLANLNTWASTLVTINNVIITRQGAPNSAGQNYSVADATGNLVSFVRTASGIVVPEGGAASITGYISIYQQGTNPAVAQLTLRSSSDIVNGGQGGGSTGSTITLGNTSPYLINFDGIGGGLPAGVSVVTGAGAGSAGTAGNYSPTVTTALWRATGAGFKNYASATGLPMSADSAAQVTATNRALGVRQTSSTGYDPGAAFVFQLANTTGKNNLRMEFLLQSLDTSSAVGRTTTWAVDYALGDAPTSFTSTTATGTLVTGNRVYSSNAVSVTLPAAVNNQSQKVWIRILTPTATTGSGNRPSTAIDDVRFLWN